MSSVVIGSVGVGLLLAAFFLNLFGFLKQRSRWYALLNIVGAGLSGYASWLIDYMPFVVLESTWCVVAIIGLIRSMSDRGNSADG